MADQNAIVPTEVNVRLGSLVVSNPHDVIVQATAVAKELAKIVKDNHLSKTIQNRDYVVVEGWSTMGAMLGVLPREVPELFKMFEDGSCEATVELIRISDGAVIGRASAYVGVDEKDRYGKLTWGSRPIYARRSMAVTRATGKAYRLGFSWIMGLAGYAPTPAEEMEGVIDAEVREVAQEKPPSNGNGKSNGDKPNTETIDLLRAKAIVGSDGKAYGDCTSDDLAKKLIGITKGLKKENLDNAKQSEYLMKADAVKLILADRGVLA